MAEVGIFVMCPGNSPVPGDVRVDDFAKNTAHARWSALELGPFDPESNALTLTRSSRLTHTANCSVQNTVNIAILN